MHAHAHLGTRVFESRQSHRRPPCGNDLQPRRLPATPPRNRSGLGASRSLGHRDDANMALATSWFLGKSSLDRLGCPTAFSQKGGGERRTPRGSLVVEAAGGRCVCRASPSLFQQVDFTFSVLQLVTQHLETPAVWTRPGLCRAPCLQDKGISQCCLPARRSPQQARSQHGPAPSMSSAA